MSPSYTGFAVSIWIKSSGNTSDNAYFSISQINRNNTQDQTVPQYMLWMMANDSTGMLTFCNFNNKSSVGAGFYNYYSNVAYNVGGWNHIVWSISSTGVTTIYTNGVARYMNWFYDPAPNFGSTLPTTAYNNGLYPYITLGSTFYNTQYYNGGIDDLRIYSSSLTPSQVTTLYNLT